MPKLGSLSLTNLLYLYIPLQLLTPLYTYHMAVSKHE